MPEERAEYCFERVWYNHAIETYIAWLETGDSEDELYTELGNTRLVTLKSIPVKEKSARTRSSAVSLLSEENSPEFTSRIAVYDRAGDLIFCMENGEITCGNGLYGVVDADTAFLCLDDQEYRIELTGKAEEQMDILVDEYDENGNKLRLADYLNVPNHENGTIVLHAGCVLETEETSYSLILPDGCIKNADYSASGDEITEVIVSVYESGEGNAYGSGNYTRGDMATLTAVRGNDDYYFGGWYLDGELLSTEAIYSFICMEDMTVEAKFIQKSVCEINGHTPEIVEGIAPTCMETGWTDGSHCAVCGIWFEYPTVIDATGHTVVIDQAVAPTSTLIGLTEGSHCSVCGVTLVEQQIIPCLTVDEDSGSGSGGSSSRGSSSGSASGGGPGAAIKDTYENSDWFQNADGTWKLLKADQTFATGWAVKSNQWYYLRSSDGIMLTGWVLVDNVWYYLDPIVGNMLTGWLFWNSDWYYLKPSNGAMATGWLLINDKWYYFYDDGRLAVQTVTPDGYTVNENGEYLE